MLCVLGLPGCCIFFSLCACLCVCFPGDSSSFLFLFFLCRTDRGSSPAQRHPIPISRSPESQCEAHGGGRAAGRSSAHIVSAEIQKKQQKYHSGKKGQGGRGRVPAHPHFQQLLNLHVDREKRRKGRHHGEL